MTKNPGGIFFLPSTVDEGVAVVGGLAQRFSLNRTQGFIGILRGFFFNLTNTIFKKKVLAFFPIKIKIQDILISVL